MTTHDELGEKIEKLVEEHIAASRQAAESAVKRGFASAPRARRVEGRRRGPKKGRKRRTPEEIAALGEQFYQAVCARPGETMSVLSADLGATSRELAAAGGACEMLAGSPAINGRAPKRSLGGASPDAAPSDGPP